MKEVISVKNYYLNVKGSKKVKVITKGKKYINYSKNIHLVYIFNDKNIFYYYRSDLFTSVCKWRDIKLNELGI